MTFRGTDWNEVKRAILERDKICIRCGAKTNLIVHHIVPWGVHPDNHPDNLIVLCNKHHGTEHNYMKRMYKPSPSVRQYMRELP